MAKDERRVEPPIAAFEDRKRELRGKGMSSSQAGKQAYKDLVNKRAADWNRSA